VDVNPYLAMAATLACGYLGMVQGLIPSEPMSDSAYDLDFELPRSLEDAVALMQDCPELVRHSGRAVCAGILRGEGKGIRNLQSWHYRLGTRTPATARMTCCGLLAAQNKIKEKWMTSTRHGINWDKALQLHAAERERFIAAPQSQQLSARADQHLLFGVPLHWMDDWSTPSPCM
jgi:hypothetical protein